VLARADRSDAGWTAQFFIAVSFSFLTFPFRTPMGQTDPSRAAQFFIAVPGQFFSVSYCTTSLGRRKRAGRRRRATAQ